MPSRTAREIVRWATIVLTGGFALLVSCILLKGLCDLWFYGRGEPFFGTVFTMALFAFVDLPALRITYALLKRDYFEAINVLAIVAAVIVFFSLFSILKNTGLTKWMLDPRADEARQFPWNVARGFIRLALPFMGVAVPTALGALIYRIGNRWARWCLRTEPPGPGCHVT